MKNMKRIASNYENAGKIIAYLLKQHSQDEYLLEHYAKRDVQLSNELDKLEYGFVYRGEE